jgi:hypothetical protein
VRAYYRFRKWARKLGKKKELAMTLNNLGVILRIVNSVETDSLRIVIVRSSFRQNCGVS